MGLITRPGPLCSKLCDVGLGVKRWDASLSSLEATDNYVKKSHPVLEQAGGLQSRNELPPAVVRSVHCLLIVAESVRLSPESGTPQLAIHVDAFDVHLVGNKVLDTGVGLLTGSDARALVELLNQFLDR